MHAVHLSLFPVVQGAWRMVSSLSACVCALSIFFHVIKFPLTNYYIMHFIYFKCQGKIATLSSYCSSSSSSFIPLCQEWNEYVTQATQQDPFHMNDGTFKLIGRKKREWILLEACFSNLLSKHKQTTKIWEISLCTHPFSSRAQRERIPNLGTKTNTHSKRIAAQQFLRPEIKCTRFNP